MFSFLWFRDHRRYFYVNEQSGESQWEFPDGEEEEESQAQEVRDESLPKPTVKDKTCTDPNSTESSENPTGKTAYSVLVEKWFQRKGHWYFYYRTIYSIVIYDSCKVQLNLRECISYMKGISWLVRKPNNVYQNLPSK